MCMIDRWFRGESIYKQFPCSLTTAYQVIAPYDPLRWAFIIPGGSGNNLCLDFGNSPSQFGALVLGSAAAGYPLTEDDIGDLVREVIQCKVLSSTFVGSLWTISYNPQRWEVYQAHVASQLSKLSPS